MRFQKFLLFFLIVSLVLSLSFLQTVRAQEDSSDALIRLLREKQSELDAGQNGAKTSRPAATAAEKPVSRPAPAAVANNSSSSSDVDLMEALRRKQAELDAKEGVQKPAQQAPAPGAKPAAKPEAVAAQPAVTPAEESELLKLLREKQAELDGKTAPVTPAPEVAQPAPKPAPTPAQPSVAAQPAMSPKTEKQLLELLEKKQAELDAKEGVPAVAKKPAPAESERIRQIEAEIKAKEEAFKKSAAKQKAPAATQSPKVVSQPKAKTPATAEPVVVPDTKEARLAELLRKYKADEITPHEYHMQRAKIIAEP